MRIAFVVPTYNESENLPALSRRLLAVEPPVEIVCVDDGSPDGTGDIADALSAENPRLHVIHRTGKRGYSAASQDGLMWCLSEGFDLVGTIDADLSHDPARISDLVAAIDAGADVSIGSRYVAGGQLLADWGSMRRAVSKMGSAYARLMLGAAVQDCTSGFRLYRADILRKVDFSHIESEGYSFLIELLAQLLSHGAKITEVPITYVDRRAGHSKISNRIVLEALARTTALGVRRLFPTSAGKA